MMEGVDRLLEVLGAMCRPSSNLSTKLPANRVLIFTLIAKHGEIEQSEVERITQLPQSLVSRAVGQLSGRKEGLGVIEMDEGQDARTQTLRLTDKGRIKAVEWGIVKK